jgi:hypothetical protein
LDRLTFPEFLDGRPFHLGVMKEQIAPFTFDETKSLLGQYLLRACLKSALGRFEMEQLVYAA